MKFYPYHHLASPWELRIDDQAGNLAWDFFRHGRTEPEQIANKLNIRYDYAPFPEDFDGILMCDAGKFYIVCNDRIFKQHSPRSRFTFAHELGHALIGLHADALRSGDSPVHYSRTEFRSPDKREREADIFAASLLLPRFPFYEAIGDSFSADDLHRLGDLFGASLTAVAYRALRTAVMPAPAAVIRWDQLGRRVGCSASLENRLLGDRYRRILDVPPPDTVTARSLQELKVGIHSEVVPGDIWFPPLSDSPHEPVPPLREEVVSLGSYGWITLLSKAAAPTA